MKPQIPDDYLEDFEELNDSPLMSMDKIEWWLLKYSDIQKQILEYRESKFIDIQHEDGSVFKMPPLEEVLTKSELRFLNLYYKLERISEFHKNESFLEKEMHIYHKVKHSPADLRNWAAKHETLVNKVYGAFLPDYLDYDVNARHLNVIIDSSQEFEIYIDHEEFKYTVEFLELLY